MEWISVKDRPLIEKDNGEYWAATKDGNGEFMAAIREETNGVLGWWIHHCCLEDEIGLMVIGDTDNELAGYGIEDVEFWAPIEPPKS